MDGRQKFLRAILYIIGSALMLAVILFVMGSPAVNNPVICGRLCHNLNPVYESWQKSSHANLNCRDCHISSSYLEISNEKFIQNPIRLWLTLTGFEEPLNKDSDYSQAKMPSERCERCHRNAYRVFTFKTGITMNHDAHKEAGIPCAVCHNRVAHPQAERYDPISDDATDFAYKDFLSMKDGCWRCHSASNLFRNQETIDLIKNGKKPPSDCRACHNRDFPFPAGHLDKTWRTRHSASAKADFDQCLECHAPGKKFDNHGRLWCTVCHDEAGLERKLGR